MSDLLFKIGWSVAGPSIFLALANLVFCRIFDDPLDMTVHYIALVGVLIGAMFVTCSVMFEKELKKTYGGNKDDE